MKILNTCSMSMRTLLTACGRATPGLHWGRDTLEKLQQIQVMKAGQHSTERTVMKGLPPPVTKSGVHII